MSVVDHEVVDRIRAAAAEVSMTVPLEMVRRRSRRWVRFVAAATAMLVAAGAALLLRPALTTGEPVRPGEAICRREGLDALRRADQSGPGEAPRDWPDRLPPVRYHADAGPVTVVVFGDDRLMVGCTLLHNNVSRMDLSLASPEYPLPWTQPTKLPTLGPGGQGGTPLTVLVGWAPADTTGLTVVADGGPAHEIQRDGDAAAQMFVALFRIDPGLERLGETTITATTPDGTISRGKPRTAVPTTR